MRFLVTAAAAIALSSTPALANHHKKGEHEGHAQMDHSKMDHGAMDHAQMDHSKMDHSGPGGEMFMQHHGAAVQAALNHPSRAEDRARDVHRHPAETLAFFHVGPHMKVGEYAPGGGWYSRVLGNYVDNKGQLVGLYFDLDKAPFNDESKQRQRDAAAGFAAKTAEATGRDAARFNGYTLDAVPDGEAGTFDRILLVRMLHNLMNWNTADSEIKAMRSLLKDDGMIGIVQHRAKADAPYSYSDGSKGYLRQADVIKFMELNGFEFVAASEANANPMDTADHAEGVWEMPPVQRTKRADLADKGESDRMTLLFKKRM